MNYYQNHGLQYINNFIDKSEAQSFEWYWKHELNKKNKWVKSKPGIEYKLNKLIGLLLHEKWYHLTCFPNTAQLNSLIFEIK